MNFDDIQNNDSVVMLSVIKLNVTYKPFMLSVIMLSVIILNVPFKPFMLSIVMLSVIMLKVMPIVVTPKFQHNVTQHNIR